MHAGGKEADQGERLGVGKLLFRPQPEALAEIGQNGGVLRQRLAVVEAQGRHAPLRVDLEIVLRALLAVGEIDLLRLVLLAALFQHDMRRHRARAGSVVQRQHSRSSITRSTFALALLVSRFRRSYHLAASTFTNVGNKGTLASHDPSVPIPKFAHPRGPSDANFGIKGTLATLYSSAAFGFEVPKRARGHNDRNFKSAALVWLCI